ncbi:MAG: class II aldolase/adducin family protein [Acidobacteriota bacterium]|nr:class II aldolase/adducin family protein [Acidobacteriota bacterium]
MNDRGAAVAGGLQEWAPSVLPPLPELTPQQEMACAFRILAQGGFGENIAGHITMRDPGGEGLWINPWGLWWEEMTAGDLCRVDHDGRVLEGRWDVTPAFHIHTELHRRRPDAAVVIHNHPYHVTVLAALGLVPEMIHQTTAMFDGDLAFVEEYTGEVANAALGADLAEAIGDKSVVILANHGIIVTAGSVPEATYKAATIDRQCRLMYDVVTSGRPYTVLPDTFLGPMKRSLIERGPGYFWGGAVRQLLRRQPEVLDS